MCEHEPKYARDMCRKCYTCECYRKLEVEFLKNISHPRCSPDVVCVRPAEFFNELPLTKLERDKRNKEKAKENYQRNKTRILKRIRIYNRHRYKTDPRFTLSCNLRSRVASAIKTKSAHTHELVGCSWTFLVKYLESKFKPGMTWENRHLWHIDHIRPFASFDLTDPEQQRLACHYTNLQPLWAEENLRKGCQV